MKAPYRRLVSVWKHKNGTVAQIEKGPWEHLAAGVGDAHSTPSPTTAPSTTISPWFKWDKFEGSENLGVVSLGIVGSVVALALFLNWSCNLVFLWRWRKAEQRAMERRGSGGLDVRTIRRKGPPRSSLLQASSKSGRRDELDLLHDRLADTTSHKTKRHFKTRMEWLVFQETEAHIDAMNAILERRIVKPPPYPNSKSFQTPPLTASWGVQTEGTQPETSAGPLSDDRTQPSSPTPPPPRPIPTPRPYRTNRSSSSYSSQGPNRASRSRSSNDRTVSRDS